VRVLFDTNVLIAAYASTHGTCAAIFEHCVRSHRVLTSEFILDEFREGVQAKCGFGRVEAYDAATILRGLFEVVSESPLGEPVCRDPDDDRVLAAAIGGQADCIVTGDKDLLIIEQFQAIRILRPSEFKAFETSYPESRPGPSGQNP